MENCGVTVRSACSDAGAYALLQQEARSFSVLVTDINLGRGTTGFDVARRARQLNADLKVFYIATDAGQISHFAVNDAEILAKPFSPHALAQRLKTLIG